jgi:hypothetical protein
MMLLALAACWSSMVDAPTASGFRHGRIHPSGGIDAASVRWIAILAQASWRKPVSFETPRNVGHLFDGERGTWAPRGVFDLATILEADDLDSGLTAALETYNGHQLDHPEAAHVRYELARFGEHRVILPTHVWGPDQTWLPAQRPLDAVITLDLDLPCDTAWFKVLRTTWEATPELAQAGARTGDGSGFGMDGTRCVLRGTKTARMHTLDLLAQVDQQRPNDRSSYQVLLTLKQPVDQGCTARVFDVPAPTDNRDGTCNDVVNRRVSLSRSIRSFVSVMSGRARDPSEGPMSGFRAPLPEGMTAPDDQWLPEFGEPLPAPLPAPDPSP